MAIGNKSYGNGMLLGGLAGAAILFVVKNVDAVKFLADAWNNLADLIIANVTALSTVPVGFMEYSLAVILGVLVGLYVEYK